MNPRLAAIIQASSVLLASSFGSVLGKMALRDISPFTFVWLQIVIGGSLLTLYTFGIRRERIPNNLSREVWAYIIWLGIGNFAIVRVLFMLALERLPATTHIYLINFVGFITMFMSVFILHEHPSIFQVSGALISFVGLWVFFREVPPPAELVGVIYIAIAIVALASTNNIGRKLALVTHNKLSNSVISTVALWIGGLPVVLAGLTTAWPPASLGVTTWGIIVLNAVVGITITLTVWNYILRTLRSYEASILASATVIYTALFAIPILGERLGLHQMGGILLMLVGLALAQVRRTRVSLHR